MSPRVTLSVPDELNEKIEKWKSSFNLSKVFQKAISEEIEKKEGFQKRLKEETNMTEIIGRLKKEREADMQDYFELGKKDGLDWAKAARYKDLKYAFKWETSEERLRGNLNWWDPTKDEVLGDYFKEVIEDDECMDFDETSPGHYVPNEYFQEWENGWKEAIEEFWAEIKDKI